MWLRVFTEAPAPPSALSSKAPRRALSASSGWKRAAGLLCAVLPTQHSAKPRDTRDTCFAQVEHLPLLFIYRLFIDGFGEFYCVSAKFEWSVSICFDVVL